VGIATHHDAEGDEVALHAGRDLEGPAVGFIAATS
jgi:hypothetical protein